MCLAVNEVFGGCRGGQVGFLFPFSLLVAFLGAGAKVDHVHQRHDFYI